ncbi:MAG: ATP synthase subunit I [Bordetella sp.]|nr:MAG: ATP synthase subunit I [Bordetella sp.]
MTVRSCINKLKMNDYFLLTNQSCQFLIKYLFIQVFTSFCITIIIGISIGKLESLSILIGSLIYILPNLIFACWLIISFSKKEKKIFNFFLGIGIFKPFLIAFIFWFVSQLTKNFLSFPFILIGFLCTLKSYFFIPIFRKFFPLNCLKLTKI